MPLAELGEFSSEGFIEISSLALLVRPDLFGHHRIIAGRSPEYSETIVLHSIAVLFVLAVPDFSPADKFREWCAEA